MTAETPAWSASLRRLLALQPQGWSEYELLGQLDAEPDNGFAKGDLSTGLNLFQTHFLLFHALYRLRDELLLERVGQLEISALSIRILPLSERCGQDLAEHDPLRDYYLDLSNLDETDESAVETLLGQFWQRYLLHERRAEYLAVLQLSEAADAAQIREQYRRLAMQHHPDRGGDTEMLQRINAAYAALTGR